MIAANRRTSSSRTKRFRGPDDDRAAFEALSGEALADLVERRTGVRPVHNPHRIWAIIHHLPEEALAWDAATKAAFLEEHETRPLAPWQRKARA